MWRLLVKQQLVLSTETFESINAARNFEKRTDPLSGTTFLYAYKTQTSQNKPYIAVGLFETPQT